MEKNRKKYIGINQRIPFAVLDSAIYHWLKTGEVDKEIILSHIKEFTKGENRALKVVSYVSTIFNKQLKILSVLSEKMDASKWHQMPENERKAIALCVVCLTFPIGYDLLVAIAAGLKTQPQVSKQFINARIASLYGTNRTVDVALDALLPMIIEAGTIIRAKNSIYSAAPQNTLLSGFTIELVIFTDIQLAGLKSLMLDEVSFRPWISYFRFSKPYLSSLSLLRYDDNGMGKGYLSIATSPLQACAP
jgi:hypothetical protein